MGTWSPRAAGQPDGEAGHSTLSQSLLPCIWPPATHQGWRSLLPEQTPHTTLPHDEEEKPSENGQHTTLLTCGKAHTKIPKLYQQSRPQKRPLPLTHGSWPLHHLLPLPTMGALQQAREPVSHCPPKHGNSKGGQEQPAVQKESALPGGTSDSGEGRLTKLTAVSPKLALTTATTTGPWEINTLTPQGPRSPGERRPKPRTQMTAKKRRLKSEPLTFLALLFLSLVCNG